MIEKTLNLINKQIKIQLKTPMLLCQRISKLYYKTLVTSVINSHGNNKSFEDIKNIDIKEILNMEIKILN